MSKLNQLQIGDSIYTLTKADRNGALASRSRRGWHSANPHRADSQHHYDSTDGFSNEENGAHKIGSIDAVMAKQNGTTFVTGSRS